MPDIFKALASIGAWFLFVLGWLLVLITLAFMVITVAPEGFAEPPAIQAYLAIACGIASVTLSVVVMKLRKGLE